MSKEKIADLERIASNYHTRIIQGWEHLYQRKCTGLVEKFSAFFPRGRALEMGVGDGAITRELLGRFDELTALDGSSLHLAEMLRTLPEPDRAKVRPVHCLFEDFHPDRPFDAVFLTHVLEHLADPVAVLAKVRTWLKPGGVACIATPNSRSLHRHVGVALGLLPRPDALNEQDKMLGHYRVYDPELLRAQVREAGFDIVHFGGLMVKPLSNRQIEAQWPPELIEAFFAISDDFPEICSEIYLVATPRACGADANRTIPHQGAPMPIPLVDLAAQYATIKEEIRSAIDDVLATTAFIRGPRVAAFETAFAAFCGVPHAVGVGNGTDALTIALKALGLGPGDEVLVPANSFIASSEAVSLAGARPVFVDVAEDSFLMDLSQAEAKITDRTKAILPVHLFGQPLDLEAVRALADAHGLKIVQDCAQAHGATVDGRPLAAFGDVCCYSFYPGKNLGAYGDAGAIVTADAALAERCRMIANHGRLGKYDHEFEGVNSRMDGLQGAVLGVKLPHLDGWIEARRAKAGLYDRLLGDLNGCVTPTALPGRRHVYHLYVVRHRDRDGLAAFLKENGVSTGIHYPIPLPLLRAYARFGHTPADFPVASRLAGEILSLPLYPELTTAQIEHIAACLRAYGQGNPA